MTDEGVGLGTRLRALDDADESRHPLDEIASHALWPAGKLFRPRLVVTTCLSLREDALPALPFALAVEQLHTGTLVHDDIIDHDDLRRGRPSVVARFGVCAAITAGDMLILRALRTAASNRFVGSDVLVSAQRILAHGGERVCQGEYEDGFGADGQSFQLRDYLRTAELKTGALIGASCALGALAGGGSTEQVEAAHRFGLLLGVAFQMRDDLLMYTLEGADAGKDLRSDLREGRATLPVVLALRYLGPNGRAAVRGFLRRQSVQSALPARDDVADAGIDAVINLVLGSRAAVDGVRMVGAAASLAAESLDVLPAGPYRDELADLAMSVAVLTPRAGTSPITIEDIREFAVTWSAT